MFDWLTFLHEYRIEYVSTGPNVASGNVNVKCPFCGHDDPSHHMGISTEGAGWSCWRNKREHSGKNPTRLVQALLRCSQEEARRITGVRALIADDFLTQVTGKLETKHKIVEKRQPLELLPEFKPWNPDLPSCRPFINYLKRERGFTNSKLVKLYERYDIHYATRGPYRGRIIFPVYYKGELVSWSGRTIYKTEPVRYKALTTKPEKAETEGVPLAMGPINSFLLWYDEIRAMKNPQHIFVTEGPFDALNIRQLGRSRGITSTCLFGLEATPEQIDLLYDLLPRFRYKHIMLDRAAFPQAMQLANALQGTGTEVAMLPERFKDPAELDKVSLLNI